MLSFFRYLQKFPGYLWQVWAVALLSLLAVQPVCADEIGLAEPLFEQSYPYRSFSDNQHFRVEWRPVAAPALNRMQRWQLLLSVDFRNARAMAQLAALTPDSVRISGGMPAHAHGLPTRPQVVALHRPTPHQVILEVGGLKFQMWGEWFLRVAVPSMNDQADVHFSLAP